VAAAVPVLQEGGVPNFATGERALAALARMAEHRASAIRGWAPPATGMTVEERRLPGPAGAQMLEPEGMAWLRENGFPVPDYGFAVDVDEVVESCRAVGYPVVMKVVSPEIVHKSDYGGVILDIHDDEAALEAYGRIQRAAAGRGLQGVIVTPMIRGAQEVLLGLSRDPQFGPVVAFGLGGIYTEVWRDIALRVAPVGRAEAQRMIQEIASFPLLRGVRGEAPRDLEALTELLVKFSWLPFQYPELDEVDLNPVFLLPQGLVVGDVRVIRSNHTKEQVGT
jgi:acyl-CoA synthetase (NDP forming)